MAGSSVIFSKPKILHIKDLYQRRMAIFMCKHWNNMLPNSICNFFTRLYSFLQSNMRCPDYYYITTLRLDSVKRSFLFQGPVLWKNLDSTNQSLDALSYVSPHKTLLDVSDVPDLLSILRNQYRLIIVAYAAIAACLDIMSLDLYPFSSVPSDRLHCQM